jgi:hypothetical protein
MDMKLNLCEEMQFPTVHVVMYTSKLQFDKLCNNICKEWTADQRGRTV